MFTIWPTSFFWKVLTHLSNHTKGWAIFVGFLAFITGGIPALVTSAISWMANELINLTWSELMNADLSTIEYIGYVNAVLPVTEFVYLLGVYCTAWAVVIMVRWVKSLIPTASN